MTVGAGDVRYFFYDDKAMSTRITLSQLNAAAPEFSFPLSEKPVSQPALSQTLVLVEDDSLQPENCYLVLPLARKA